MYICIYVYIYYVSGRSRAKLSVYQYHVTLREMTFKFGKRAIKVL